MDPCDACRLIGYFCESLQALGPAYLLGYLAWRVGS